MCAEDHTGSSPEPAEVHGLESFVFKIRFDVIILILTEVIFRQIISQNTSHYGIPYVLQLCDACNAPRYPLMCTILYLQMRVCDDLYQDQIKKIRARINELWTYAGRIVLLRAALSSIKWRARTLLTPLVKGS
jgi:hypothetical protein